MKDFPALFVRTVTFSVFEHCNKLLISQWKQQYLFNQHVKYLLTVNVNLFPNNAKLLGNSRTTHSSTTTTPTKMAKPRAFTDSTDHSQGKLIAQIIVYLQWCMVGNKDFAAIYCCRLVLRQLWRDNANALVLILATTVSVGRPVLQPATILTYGSVNLCNEINKCTCMKYVSSRD
jgi:hypothetical protein